MVQHRLSEHERLSVRATGKILSIFYLLVQYLHLMPVAELFHFTSSNNYYAHIDSHQSATNNHFVRT